ncbi:MAG: chorismate synthase [Bacteroidales bacterium]|nr:chorismate synthase [Bacteroidales bacterium]
MNTFGRKFRVSIFGESHGPAIGCTIDGVFPGTPIILEDLEKEIARRKSGGKGTTPRTEADKPIILSGVLDDHATGAPLTIVFLNENTHSSDYEKLLNHPRPGHADFVAGVKYADFQDPRGGGHFSGRLTLPIVAAGYVAKQVFSDIVINAELIEVGGVVPKIPAHAKNDPEVLAAIAAAEAEGDSLGGIVECTVKGRGLEIGYGEPFWDSVEALISHAIFSIPGVRGIEFGDGFQAARMKGSEHNDPIGADCLPVKNGAGGVNGGITNGAPILFRVAFKPTSSIRKPQLTMNFEEEKMTPLVVPGRHDVCFALRTPVVVEAMTAIVMADLLEISDLEPFVEAD